MSEFAGKVALITGGASGIGRAVGAALAQQGARMVLADIDGGHAEATARELGGKRQVRSSEVDVTDAAAVQAAVRAVAEKDGRLDYLFNNAGIGLIGEARDMNAGHWQRVLDVNLRGVVHGVQAAYPVMIAQGFGHIINTGSIFGLVPSPLSVAYATTKHAVVGLSTSLRAEAAALGVRVSVVCPGFVATPMKDANLYLKIDKDQALRANPFRMHSSDAVAREILSGVARNRAVIVISPPAKLLWYLHRLAPTLFQLAAGLVARRMRGDLRVELRR